MTEMKQIARPATKTNPSWDIFDPGFGFLIITSFCWVFFLNIILSHHIHMFMLSDK